MLVYIYLKAHKVYVHIKSLVINATQAKEEHITTEGFPCISLGGPLCLLRGNYYLMLLAMAFLSFFSHLTTWSCIPKQYRFISHVQNYV